MPTNHAEEQYPDLAQDEQLVPVIGRLPERYRESLIRTRAIAGLVGSELGIYPIHDVNNIPPEPGVYMFNDSGDIQKYSDVVGAKFDVDTKTLSGKVDSAHAVLPGMLSILYRNTKGKMVEKRINVAAKGYYKRELFDRFERVTREVGDSYQQGVHGELSYDPVAVIIAPTDQQDRVSAEPDYDFLLLTKLDQGATSLDNVPWQLGFDEANLELAGDAVASLARFNTLVGMHGDAKIKNVAQRPNGQTSMIDFETSKGIDWRDPGSVSMTIYEDLSKLLESLGKLGFFSAPPYHVKEVLNELGQTYLDYWRHFSSDVQEAASQSVIKVIDNCIETYA